LQIDHLRGLQTWDRRDCEGFHGAGRGALATFSGHAANVQHFDKRNDMNNRKRTNPARMALAALLAILIAAPASAQTREQARRIHDRLAGVPPTENVLQSMTTATTASHQVCADNGLSGAQCAAYIAMEDPNFYSMIRDDYDFRRVLWDDVQFVGRSGTVSAPPAANNNDHYAQLEAGNHNLKDVLEFTPQSNVNGLLPQNTAGVITSRAAAEAFFIAGTNRAMFRFTMVNHFCKDMEQLHDPRLSPDRIRQDVSRSPGGDSRLFLNNCVGCHTGMDPLAQAFAYYNYDETAGRIEYTDGEVQDKYFNNEGAGAQSMGRELAYSDAFSSCQVRKVFKAVCLREPETTTDHQRFNQFITNFESSGFRMKQVFADTAEYCMGQ
jgi:hypothetical protein